MRACARAALRAACTERRCAAPAGAGGEAGAPADKSRISSGGSPGNWRPTIPSPSTSTPLARNVLPERSSTITTSCFPRRPVPAQPRTSTRLIGSCTASPERGTSTSRKTRSARAGRASAAPSSPSKIPRARRGTRRRIPVKFTWFNLMPWPHLPEDFRQTHRSVWVDIDSALYDPVEGNRVYHEYMDQLEYADSLGFDGIGVNEHHQNAYGLMPSPNIIAAGLARRTSRAAIAVIGNSIALY